MKFVGNFSVSLVWRSVLKHKEYDNVHKGFLQKKIILNCDFINTYLPNSAAFP